MTHDCSLRSQEQSSRKRVCGSHSFFVSGAPATEWLSLARQILYYTRSHGFCQAFFAKILHKFRSQNLCNLYIDFYDPVCYSIIKRWGNGDAVSRASATLTKMVDIRNKPSLPSQETKEKRKTKWKLIQKMKLKNGSIE